MTEIMGCLFQKIVDKIDLALKVPHRMLYKPLAPLYRYGLSILVYPSMDK